MPTATETPTQTVTFHSKCPNQVLTRRPARYVQNDIGGRELLGETEWFERMREKGEPFDETPWKVEFDHHIFKTDDAELIEWLRRQPTFNANTPSGFWESGAAPDEPRPTINEQMARISKAGVQLDVDALQDVIKTEKATHNRPSILQAADVALLVIEAEPPESGADAGTKDGSPSTSNS